jgi:hypothetical protein
MGLFGKGKGGGLMNVIRCDRKNTLCGNGGPRGKKSILQQGKMLSDTGVAFG